ncbi:uncharacterized protein LOC113316076 [Papaver somniferum]|uniref:uncharacterized protein LOC113316076 n=1 Tax=Papaver somniferum TaxID=3469 RepID=UPI000E6F4F7B|nr:uncharacterized protein LOC113316076 [Papaver somniferum]
MRVFYWNAQGLAKDGARDKLKELYHLHKPNVICIAEPKVFCTTRFVRSLRLDDFSEDVITNKVVGEKGNIWVLWRHSLARPGILSSSKQAISLNFDGDWITAVHASSDPVARRNLWQQLGLGFVSVPWLSGDRRIVSRNDRAVVNDARNYKYENWRCKALPRICSDHSPLFGYAFESPRPARDPFIIQKMWLDHPRFMPLVKDNWNLPFYGAPPFVFAGKLKRLKEVLKLWNRTFFGDVQFRLKQAELRLESENDLLDLDPADEFQFTKVADAQKEVDEVQTDFVKEKFNGGVDIDPKLFDIDHERISTSECSFMDAIPSLEEIKRAVFDLGADSAPGPDGFSGSFYRHCWNIIADDLLSAIKNCCLMGKIPNGINSSFIFLIPKNSRSDAIKDFRPIGLSNFFFKIITNIWLPGLNFGNVGLKLDIAQAFDTVSWEFIAEVFRQYGFSETWCSWIHSILSSARISVLINGSPEGFFSITRGLHQGDPLSPLIFVLIEDILSRNLSKLFANRSMHSMSKFYYGGGTNSRAIVTANYLGVERAIFPDKYLGIQLKPGIVRHIHVRQVVEKIMDKLAGWKGKLLSFQARLVLIRSVIASYVIHSMAVYKWPANIMKQVERAIRNFLWSGDAEKRKYFTVLYDNRCCSRREGGLRLKKLIDVKKSMLMKLWISIRDSNNTWARFLRAKRLGITSKGPNDFKAKVSDIIVDGAWVIPHNLRILLVRLNIDVDNMHIIGGGEDYKVWDLDSKGVFSVKSAKTAIREPAEVFPITTLFSRPVVHPTLSAQYWKVWAKQCCDSDDNVIKKTGPAGAGVTFRDANAAVLEALSVGLGLQTNYFAEVCAVIYGAMLANRWNMRKLCVQSDSMSCIQAFQNDALPWQLRQKWRLARNFYSNIRFIHKYREVNFSTDASAKQACLLDEDIFEFSEGRPISMLSI